MEVIGLDAEGGFDEPVVHEGRGHRQELPVHVYTAGAAYAPGDCS